MVRTLLRLVLALVVIVGIGAFVFGYRWGGARTESVVERPVATTGSAPTIDTSRARQAGAEIGEKVAIGANRAEQALGDASLTAKIKSKIALDDTLDGSAVHVATDVDVVTLSGSVKSDAQRRRALQLARETDGVASVVDRLHAQ